MLKVKSTEVRIKLSDFVIKFIEELGVKHVFLISGGGNIHLIDSIGKSKKLSYICNHHEQACAIAAEAYSRIKENLGVAIVTTGPGGTNAITGVFGAWTDSIPLLVISGQVKRELMIDDKKLRQLGDQEIRIVDIVKPITKYAQVVADPLDIRYHLEKAVYLAKNGRPGPVWIDIPNDVQGTYIETDKLKKFNPEEIKPDYESDDKYIKTSVNKTLQKLKNAKRPVIIAGHGIRLSHSVHEFLELIKLLKVPVLTTFTGYDILGTDNEFYFGRGGIVGQRSANFLIQNADLLLILGSRLNIRQIGYNYQAFGRGAYKIMVDIDNKELDKKTIKPDLSVNCNLKDYIKELSYVLKTEKIVISVSDWLKQGRLWQQQYPQILPGYQQEKDYVNCYYFVGILSKYLTPQDIFTVSDGTACVAPYQALKFPQGVKIAVNSGCAAMGYGLPAAIGACFANNKKSTICFEGDGSLQINIQELQTIVHHKLPIKIFVFENNGYVSIRITQKTLFNGIYVASDPESGVTCPDIIKIAKAYGIKSYKIKSHKNMEGIIKKVLSASGPAVCQVTLSPNQDFIPKVISRQLPDGSFVSSPLEDMYPFLTREELKKNMLIPLWEDE